MRVGFVIKILGRTYFLDKCLFLSDVSILWGQYSYLPLLCISLFSFDIKFCKFKHSSHKHINISIWVSILGRHTVPIIICLWYMVSSTNIDSNIFGINIDKSCLILYVYVIFIYIPTFWSNDELFVIINMFLTSWRTFDDIANFLTSWYALTSWRTYWSHDVFLTS